MPASPCGHAIEIKVPKDFARVLPGTLLAGEDPSQSHEFPCGSSVSPCLPGQLSFPSQTFMTRPIRLLVCDDSIIVRKRVRATAEHLGFHIVGEAGTGAESVALSLALKPDLVLMDISMPDFSGIEATRQILAQAPGIKVLAFSSDAEKKTVDEMLASGALGYVVKTGLLEVLAQAMQTVSSGEPFLDPRLRDAGPPR
jgi:CheY-like chemotaxis protein